MLVVRKSALINSNISVDDSLVGKIQMLMRNPRGCLIELFEIQIAIVVSIQATEELKY